MFLKFRYRLGYETLCREVDDSITWRRFCQIPLDGHLAHPTTLMKLTTRCGSAAVDGYSQALLAKAAQTKLLRTARLRVDTTVVPADVAYPTDSGVLARAVRRVATTAPPAACTPPAVPPAPGSATAAAPPEPGPAEFARSCGCARHKGRDKAQATVRRVTLIRDGRGELVVTPQGALTTASTCGCREP